MTIIKISWNNVYETQYENNTNLLNNFNHLLSRHEHEFEEIHDILSTSLRPCLLSECIMMKINYRDWATFHNQLYFDEDDHGIITQQLLDRVHCYWI